MNKFLITKVAKDFQIQVNKMAKKLPKWQKRRKIPDFCKNTTVQCITGEKKLTGITLNDGDAHWAGDFSLVDRPQC